MVVEPEELRNSEMAPPFDKRILSLDSRAIRLLISAAVFQMLTVVAQVVQAVAFGSIVAAVILRNSRMPRLAGSLLVLSGASLVIVLAGFVQDLFLARTAGRIKSNLRARLMEKASRLGLRQRSGTSATSVMLLATKGLGDIETYLIRFVPAAIYAFLAPVVLIGYTTFRNPIAGITEIVTLSAVPPLMITFGRTAGSRAQEKWRSLQRLSAQFVESMVAIPTLKGIGATGRQETLIDDASKQLERDTMSTLYLAFLSTGVLELVTTVAIALVAVGIGIRLADGSIALAPSVTILILAPVVYLSVRNASMQFHTTVDARVAIDAIVSRLGQDGGSLDGRVSRDYENAGAVDSKGILTLEHLSIDRFGLTIAEDLNLELMPNMPLCIVGPSGGGKTTLLRVVAGLESAQGGAVRYRGMDLAQLPGGELADLVSFLPQNPTFFEASLRDNILVGRPDPGVQRFNDVMRDTLLDELVEILPGGLDFRISEFGQTLSGGERQRVALARALLLRRPILIMDEPTSFLDSATEAKLWANVISACEAGVLLYATHRNAIAVSAASILQIDSGRPMSHMVGGRRHG